MYFAVNPWSKDATERLLSSLQTLREQTQRPVYRYILLDASFDQHLPSAFPWRRHVECTLYDDSRLSGLKAVAPHLLRFPDESEKQLGWLNELIAVCAEKPMLSILFSAVPAGELLAHFRPYLLARTEDSLEWPVRWADTRVLPALIATMTPIERNHFMAPLHRWSCLDRTGEMLEWIGNGSQNPAPADFDCWPLDDARFSQLVDEAEADVIISTLHETQPDLFDGQEPPRVHATVKKNLALASRYGLETARARRHFAMLALLLNDEFADHPAMQAVLNKSREGGDYAAEIAALPADFWHQTERKT